MKSCLPQVGAGNLLLLKQAALVVVQPSASDLLTAGLRPVLDQLIAAGKRALQALQSISGSLKLGDVAVFRHPKS